MRGVAETTKKYERHLISFLSA